MFRSTDPTLQPDQRRASADVRRSRLRSTGYRGDERQQPIRERGRRQASLSMGCVDGTNVEEVRGAFWTGECG